jgi:hypothetical protein
MATNTMDSILGKYQKEWDAAKAANEQRYQQGMQILDQAIQRYQPEGDFGKGAESQYNIGKTQAMSQGMSSLIGSGLSNTTVAATMPIKYEQEVGTPFRLQLNDMRMQNLTKAEQAKTAFIQDREDMYPDLNMMAELAMKAQQSENRTTTTTYAPSTLSSFGKTDPGISARNAAQKIERQLKDAQRAEANRAAQARRSALTTNNNQNTGSSTPSMSSADYQALLEKNLGFTVAPTTMTGPNLPTGNYQKKEESTYNPFTYTGNY